MPLTQRADGTNAINLVDATWWEEYRQLLTGVMTDQPVTIANNLGVTGQGSVFQWNGTLNAVDRQVLYINPTDAGVKKWALYLINSDSSLLFRDVTDVTTPLRLFATGDATIGRNLTITGTLKSDANAISSDGSGNLTALGMKATNYYAPTSNTIGFQFKDNSGATAVEFDALAPAATSRGIVFAGWDGTALHQGVKVDPNGVITLTVYDGALGTTKTVRIFIGTVDPATYTTVNDGDIWLKA